MRGHVAEIRPPVGVARNAATIVAYRQELLPVLARNRQIAFSTNSAIALRGFDCESAMMVIAFQSSPMRNLPRSPARLPGIFFVATILIFWESISMQRSPERNAVHDFVPVMPSFLHPHCVHNSERGTARMRWSAVGSVLVPA